MPFDYELAKRIFEEMGIEWDSNASELIVDGNPLSEDFDVDALFGFDDLPQEEEYRSSKDTPFSIPFDVFGEQDNVRFDDAHCFMADAA